MTFYFFNNCPNNIMHTWIIGIQHNKKHTALGWRVLGWLTPSSKGSMFILTNQPTVYNKIVLHYYTISHVYPISAKSSRGLLLILCPLEFLILFICTNILFLNSQGVLVGPQISIQKMLPVPTFQKLLIHLCVHVHPMGR